MSPHDEPTQSSTLFGRGPQACPICAHELPTGAATDSPLYPFCSRRCKLIDLSRWTEGKYAIVEQRTIDELLEQQARHAAHETGDAHPVG
jgi:hypothetical protein